jgi:hypothetical protein
LQSQTANQYKFNPIHDDTKGKKKDDYTESNYDDDDEDEDEDDKDDGDDYEDYSAFDGTSMSKSKKEA